MDKNIIKEEPIKKEVKKDWFALLGKVPVLSWILFVVGIISIFTGDFIIGLVLIALGVVFQIHRGNKNDK